VARAADHVVFDASRQGRAAEIAAWANAASAFAVAGGTAALLWARFASHAAWIGLLAGAVSLLVLRLALTHRYTVWFAAVVGTLTVAAAGGSVAWLFGHVVEAPSAPSIAAVLGSLGAALPPAWGYSQLAKRRANDDRDSLIDPVSVPSSR
jgi:hypothetical protein